MGLLFETDREAKWVLFTLLILFWINLLLAIYNPKPISPYIQEYNVNLWRAHGYYGTINKNGKPNPELELFIKQNPETVAYSGLKKYTMILEAFSLLIFIVVSTLFIAIKASITKNITYKIIGWSVFWLIWILIISLASHHATITVKDMTLNDILRARL